MEYIYVVATAISAAVAIWKSITSGKKSSILKAVIEGVESTASFIPKKDLKAVKETIAGKAEKYGVAYALDKVVKLVTKEK